MKNWFECVVKYDKLMENGMQKKVSEPYLVDALSFTEAEARIIQEMTPFISGDFEVKTIKKENYIELLFDETADRYYRCKLNFISSDDAAGERKTSYYYLVQANTVDQANDHVISFMKDSLADFEIESIKETKIIDVYPYESES